MWLNLESDIAETFASLEGFVEKSLTVLRRRSPHDEARRAYIRAWQFRKGTPARLAKKARRERALEMLRAGATRYRVAKTLGVAQRTVRRWAE